MTLQEMQRQLTMCCGGPCVNRKPIVIHKRPLTGIEKEAQLQKLDAIETEYQREFGGNK